MGSQDNEFVALGPSNSGFRTHATRISTGVDVSGTIAGVVGRCQGVNNSGVFGFGTGTQGAGCVGTSDSVNGNGVIADAHNGARAFAIWDRSGSGLAAKLDCKVEIKGDLQVTGRKSAAVALPDGKLRLLYALESPGSWFEDFGFGQLVDGYSEIALDETFRSVTSDDRYHVFITEYEGNNSLYVTGRTSAGFEVRSGTSTGSGEFSYRIVAKRKDVPESRFEEVSAHEEELADEHAFSDIKNSSY